MVENLPETPEGCGGASPNVQEGFQVQLGYEVSLAVGGDYEWTFGLHQDDRGMEVEFVGRSHGRSGRQLRVQVGISFTAQQVGFPGWLSNQMRRRIMGSAQNTLGRAGSKWLAEWYERAPRFASP
jgi:hypothetical protein